MELCGKPALSLIIEVFLASYFLVVCIDIFKIFDIYILELQFSLHVLIFPDIVATLYDILEKTVFESHTRAT